MLNESTALLKPQPPLAYNSTDVAVSATRSTNANGNRNSDANAKEITPLPIRQVVILSLMRFGEPIAFTVIYPFISQFLEDLKVSEDVRKIGYYAGVIESLFAATTFLTILFWGRLSDRIGRKPVLVFGLLGVAGSVAAFGMSTSFVGLVITRCLGGALNGNVAVIKSSIAELSDETNQGRAFSFLPLAWAGGCVIGPIIGGFLSNPATNYPSVFGNNAFFIAHPYALPCFVGAIFPALGAILGLCFLEETLPSRPSPSPPSLETGVSSTPHQIFTATTSTTIPAVVAPPVPTAEELVQAAPPKLMALVTKPVISALVVYSFLALETVALDALLVLFCYTRISLGGLSFSESDIGAALSFSGVFSVATQVLLFPYWQRRYGTVKLYKGLMHLYPAIFLCFPIMSYLATKDQGTGWGRKRVWTVMIVFLVAKSIANMAYSCNMLTITSASPSRRLLGSLNGIAQMCSSAMRALGPIGASSLFAYSIEHDHLARGEFVFVCLIGLATLATLATSVLIEEAEEGGWRSIGKVVREEGEGEDVDRPREQLQQQAGTSRG